MEKVVYKWPDVSCSLRGGVLFLHANAEAYSEVPECDHQSEVGNGLIITVTHDSSL